MKRNLWRFSIIVLVWIISCGMFAPLTHAQVKGVDVLLVLDNSLSMRTSDPQKLRIEAAKALVSYLAVKGPEGDVRIGVISLSGEPELLLSLTPVWRTKEIKESLTAKELPNTDFIAALQVAQDEFKHSGSLIEGRERIVILLTDGEPWPKTAGTEGGGQLLDALAKSHFKGIERLIESFFTPYQVRLYVLTLGEATQYRSYWESLVEKAEGELFPITSVEDILPILLQIFTPEMASVRPIAREASFTLPPYREYFIATVEKALADDIITLINPDGHYVSKSDPTIRVEAFPRGEVFRITYPSEGTWKLQSAKGDFKAWLDIGPLSFVPYLEMPTDVHPEDMNLDIRLKLLYRGNVIQDQRLEISGILTLPDGSQKSLAFSAPDNNGLYTISVLQAPLPQGDCFLSLWVTQKPVEYTQLLFQDKPFRIVAVPSITEVTLEGSYIVKEPLTVTVRLSREEEIKGKADLTAELETPAGNKLPLFLIRDSIGLWRGMISGDALQHEGVHTLSVILASGTLQNNVPFAEKRAVVRFEMHPPAIPPGWRVIPPGWRPVEEWRWRLNIGWTSFLSFLVLGFGLIAGILWARYTRVPRLILQAERALARGNVEQARKLYRAAIQSSYREGTVSSRRLRAWAGRAFQGYFATRPERALALDEAIYWVKAGEWQRQIIAYGVAKRWREYPVFFLEEARHFYQDAPADFFLFAGLSALAGTVSHREPFRYKRRKDFILGWLGIKSLEKPKSTWTYSDGIDPKYPRYRQVESPYETALYLAREIDPLTGDKLGCRWIADMRTRMVNAWLRGGVIPQDRDRDHIWVIEIEDLLQEKADPISILSLIYYEIRECLRDKDLEPLIRDLRLILGRLYLQFESDLWHKAYLVSVSLEVMAKARLDDPVPFRLSSLLMRYGLSQEELAVFENPKQAGIYHPIVEIFNALNGKTWDEICPALASWRKRIRHLGLPEGHLLEAILKRWEEWLRYE